MRTHVVRVGADVAKPVTFLLDDQFRKVRFENIPAYDGPPANLGDPAKEHDIWAVTEGNRKPAAATHDRWMFFALGAEKAIEAAIETHLRSIGLGPDELCFGLVDGGNAVKAAYALRQAGLNYGGGTLAGGVYFFSFDSVEKFNRGIEVVRQVIDTSLEEEWQEAGKEG